MKATPLLLLSIVIFSCNSSQKSDRERALKSITTTLKKSLNDPSSFEPVNLELVKDKDLWIASLKYRAKNAFGALMLTETDFKLDSNFEVVDEGYGFYYKYEQARLDSIAASRSPKLLIDSSAYIPR